MIAFSSLFTFSVTPVAAESGSGNPIQTTIYVSPEGDDSNDGTIDAPFKTIAKAKEKVRTLPKTGGDIVVQIADGFYSLDEPLVFDASDSGSESCTIRYEAAPGAKPVISGGKMLEKGVWTEATELTQTKGLKAYKTTLHRNEKLRAIYVNNKRANMTTSETITSANRTTNGTPTVSFTGTDNPWAWQNGSNIAGAIVFSANVGLSPDTKNPQNIEAESVGGSTARWARPFVCFASAEPAPDASNMPGGTMLRFQMPYAAISQSLSNNTQYNPNNNQIIRNAFEFLNKCGDFYFDQAESTLYYIPLEGEDINTADVVIPELETLIDIRGIPVGDRLNPIDGSDNGRVRYITFDGLTFSHTDYKLYELTGTFKYSDRETAETATSRGFASVQGCIVNKVYFPAYINWHETFYRGYDIPPAAIMINAARNIKVLNGEISFTGFNGIHIENDVRDIEVTGNYIRETLSSGVVVGHPTHIYENDEPIIHESSNAGIRSWAGVDKEKYKAGTEAVPQDIYITNNFLYRNCYGFPGANSLTSFYTTNMQVLHNYIYDSTYGAMSIGWGWCEYDGYGFTSHGSDKTGGPYAGTHEASLARSQAITTTSRNNKINYNRIEEVCTVVNDSGAIYSLGRQGDPGNLPGGGTWDTVNNLTSAPVTDPNSNWYHENWTNFTEMNYNYIDTNTTNRYTDANNWINGFHPDEGSTFIKMIGNVVQAKLPDAPGRSRLFEFNNWKRKSDMIAVDNYVDGDNDQNGGPRILYQNNYKSVDRIWPVKGNDIVLKSGLTDEYVHMIPKSLIADTEFELASNVVLGKGETLNRRGLLEADDTVWLAPAGTTEFNESSTMTKAAGNEKTIQAPTTAGEYKLYIVYGDGRETAVSKYTVYVDASASAVNVEDGGKYDVSAVRPLKLSLSDDFTYTLNGKPVQDGYEISTEGSWTLVLKSTTSTSTKTIKFTTTVSLANKLLPADVAVAPGGTVRFAYDLNDPTKKIWISSSSGGHYDGGEDETVTSGDALGMIAPSLPGPYVIHILAEDGTVLSQSHARVVVRDMTPVDIPRNGLDLWLKADEGIVTDDAGNVVGWKNMGNIPATLVPADVPGSNGDGLGKPTGNPKLQRNVYDYVYFDANSRPLKAADFKDYNGKTEMTIYALVNPEANGNSSSDQNGLVYFGLNESFEKWPANDGWSGINLGIGKSRINLRFGNAVAWSGGGSSYSTNISGLSSVRAQLNGSNRSVYVNNNLIGSDNNSTALTGNRPDLGVGYSMSAATPFRFLGEVVQILIYDRVLTADEVAKIEAYFDQVKAGGGGPANPVNTGVDKTLLTALIDKVDNLDKTIYTADSWKAFEKALKAAKAAASNQEIGQEDADNAYFSLRDAFKGLTLKPSGIGTAAYGTPVLGGLELDPIWNTTVSLPIIKHLTMPNGPTDGYGKVLWDEDNLYVLVHVNDSVLNKSNSAVHEQDSVEIFVDESNSKASSYGAGMGQYRINYLNETSFNPGSISTGFESYATVVDGGYYVETKIPFKTLKPGVDHVIGFDLQINDAGSTGSRQDVIMWHDETGESWNNGSKWGVVTLVMGNDTTAPTWPEGSTLTASNIGENSVTLTWTPAEDDTEVTTYEIYRGTEKIGTTQGNINSYEVMNLEAGTEYTFTVQAGDEAGNISNDGPSVTVTTLPKTGEEDTIAPTWPLGSTVTGSAIGINAVTLRWTPAEDNVGVTVYEIYNGSDLIGKVAGNINTYEVMNLNAGTEYTFTVQAGDEAGNISNDGPSVTLTTLSDDGQGDVQAPYWPEGSSITVTDVTETGLTLNWPAAEDNTVVTGYVIYNGDVQIAVLPGNATSYRVSGLKAGIRYTFTVKAKDSRLNWSEPGLSITATVGQIEPQPQDTTAPIWPEGSELYASGVSKTSLWLNWTAAQDDTKVTSYRVYRDSTLIATVPGNTNSYFVSGLSSGTTYMFSVQAGDAAGNWSSNGPSVYVTTNSESSGGNGGGGNSGGNSGGSSSGSSTTTTTTTEIKGSGKVKISAPVVVKGTAMVTVDANDLVKTLNQAKVATIEVPNTTGVNGYVVSLPTSVFGAGNASKSIEIVTEAATVILPLNMFSAADLAGADRIEIVIDKVDTSGLDSAKKAIIGDRSIVDIKLVVNGKEKAWSNEGAPLTIKIPYNPTPSELANPEYLTAWYLDQDGNAVKMKDAKYVPSEKAMVFTTTHLSKYAVVYLKIDFNDMQKHAWAVEAVKALAENGIIEGTSGTEFSPSMKITREEYVAWLVRTLGLNADFEENFSDVKETDKYYREIGIAKELGISVGYNGKFSPEREISRQELVTLTINALKIANKPLEKGTDEDISKYTDAGKIAKYATESMATMVRMGFITGNSKTTLNPLGATTRAEAAVILYKIYTKAW